jgi:glycosyltransferase involved in cell wall biosynthesis
VIAVGRWDAYQKNAPLLAAMVDRVCRLRPSTEFLIVGRGADAALSAVAKRNPAVHLLGVQSRECVVELMAECRTILITSRWESGPIVANEMLALGGTVVGTPIPTLAGVVADPRFGRVGRRHRADDCAIALAAELADWDRGLRDPAVIADHWRARVGPAAVGKRFADIFRSQAPTA